MTTNRETEDDAPTRRTALGFIKAMHDELTAAQVRTVMLRDPGRAEYVLTCEVPSDLDATEDIEERAKKAAKSENAPSQLVIGNCMLLARYTRQLRVRGKDVSDDTEGSVFADREVQDQVGAPNAWRAVRELFIVEGGKYDDGVIARLAKALLDEGGLTNSDGVEVEAAEDPT